MIGHVIEAMENGLLPDAAVRMGIRRLCTQRLNSFRALSLDELRTLERNYIQELKNSPVAACTDEANQQHYELPPAFFEKVLGKNLKYSSGFWPEGCDSLDESERAALEETCRRADLKPGQKILELGCGWGSLTITMARAFPTAQIVAISNSAPQRLYIEERARKAGVSNVKILTRNIADVTSLENEFPAFDRVVSVEMFEHMKNYEQLLERISRWLAPEGKLFVHIFTHRQYSYPFDTEGEDNWMGKYFFTGGQMPSHHLLTNFQKNLLLEKSWAWNGTHYARTSRAWLENMTTHKSDIMPIFMKTYGSESSRWFHRWRIFFMACEELFNYSGGSEWGVSHYLFNNRRSA